MLKKKARSVATNLPAVGLLLLASCTAPIGVSRIEAGRATQGLNANAATTGEISEPTRIALSTRGFSGRFKTDPDGTLRALHRLATSEGPDQSLLFALAELSYLRAVDTGQRVHNLSSAVYAYAFLFPTDRRQRADAFDPRLRAAADFYNLGLERGLASADGNRLEVRSSRYELPFGSIDIATDPRSVRLGDVQLTRFVPLDGLRLSGLQNRFRKPGLGVAIAANAQEAGRETGLRLVPDLSVPATALLQIDLGADTLANGRLRGTLTIYPADEPAAVDIQGQAVPLQTDSSAAIALSLSNPALWDGELAGFLGGGSTDPNATKLVGLQPYRPGRFPVVLIHGTASSAGRWADLINDLVSDPVLRDSFQFWSFTYQSGVPTPYSALDLRTAIEATLRKLDPQGKDPALHQMVLLGHSQGGLMAKMMVVSSGSRLWDAISRRPLETLRLSPATSDLVRRALFVTPLTDVGRVIFIATPHRGSFIAGSAIGRLLGSLVSLPSTLVAAASETARGNPDSLRQGAELRRFDSVGTMSPDNPAVQALAEMPISPRVAAHSIIAVQGNGPVETGDDGVVSYSSAHLAGIESELVVRAGHSVQGDPATAREVRRILLEHLAQARGSR